MRTSSLFAAAAPLLSLAQARIQGLGIPSTIKPGDSFNLVIQGSNYIQRVTDVSIAVGYNVGGTPLDYGLGNFITAFDLVADSNTAANFNKTVTLPATAATGDATFTASLESLYGVQYEPAFYPFNVSFTIGSETSTDYTFVGLNAPVSC